MPVMQDVYRAIHDIVAAEFRRRGFVGTTLDAGHVAGTLPPGQVAHEHDLTGSEHDVSGLTTGHVLTATSASTVAFQAPTGGGGGVTTGAGPPSHSAAEGTLYWDTANDVMYVNSSGGTTWAGLEPGTSTPAPAVRVYHSVAQSIANNTATALTFDSERYDTHAAHSPSTNPTRLTVPAGMSGRWHLGASVAFDTHATGFRQAYLRLNGAAGTVIAVIGVNANASDWTQLTLACDYDLVAGDYVELVVRHTRGAALNVNASPASTPEVWMHRLSDNPGGAGVTDHDSLTGVSADDHHAQAHSLTGADHTLAGLTTGHVLTATGAAAAAFQAPAAGNHDTLTGVSADDHHAQAHLLTGADHTLSGLTTGHVLTATSATAAAFAAVTAPAMVRIAETVLGATTASVTFSSIPGTYRHLRLVCVARGDGAGTALLLAMRLQGRTDAIYDSQVGNFGAASATAGETIAATSMAVGVVTGAGAIGGEFGATEITLVNYTSTAMGKTAIGHHARKHANAAGGMFVSLVASFCRSTAAVTTIDLFPSSGNFVAGSVFVLYGMT